MKLRINKFSGTVPRRHPRLLGEYQAQVAENCNLYSGALRPLGGNRFVQAPPYCATSTSYYWCNRVYHYGTYPYQQWWTEGMQSNSTTFYNTFDADFVRSPIANNTKDRVIITGPARHLGGPPGWIDRDFIESVDEQVEDSTFGCNPLTTWELKVPRPTVTPAFAAYTPSDLENVEDRTYVITWVRTWNGIEEESAPSDPSPAISVTPGDSLTVTYSGLTTPLTYYPSVGGSKPFIVRLYRTVTSVNGTEYQFVKDNAAWTSSTQTVDDVAPEDLGDVITTTYFAEPDAALRQICSMSNGILAGFVRNEIHFCEPYQPHAWPVSYRLSIPETVISIGAVGESLVVTTDGNPYIITGVHPSAMSITKLEVPQSCVSKRSLVDMGEYIMYASPDGLIAIGALNGLITEKLLTREEWQELNPSSMRATFWDGRYLCFYDATSIGGVQGGFILDTADENATLVWLTDWYEAAEAEPDTGRVFVLERHPTSPKKWKAVKEWNCPQSDNPAYWSENRFPGGDTIETTDIVTATPAPSGGLWTITGGALARIEFMMGEDKEVWESSQSYKVAITVDTNTCTDAVTLGLFAGVNNYDNAYWWSITIPAGQTGVFLADDEWENSPTYMWAPDWLTTYNGTKAGSYYIENWYTGTSGSMAISKIDISRHPPGAVPTYKWKSKVFYSPKPQNMAAAQIFGDQSPATPLIFRMYCDGVLQYETNIEDERPFRLPGGFLAETFEFEFEGTTTVRDFHVASTMRELKTV